jgi:hypothetical protein
MAIESTVRDWELAHVESEIDPIAQPPAAVSILIVDDEDTARLVAGRAR